MNMPMAKKYNIIVLFTEVGVQQLTCAKPININRVATPPDPVGCHSGTGPVCSHGPQRCPDYTVKLCIVATPRDPTS